MSDGNERTDMELPEPSPGLAAAVPTPPPAPDSRKGPLLEARGIAKTYKVGGSALPVLRGVDLSVQEGEILAILGKSGCGNSD